MISPSVSTDVIASAAFFTKFSSTCTSWSRLPSTGGKRRIIGLDEAEMRRKAGLRQAAHMLEHAVDVDRPQLGRPLVEHLHPVHQGANAVRLVADQHGQLAVALGHAALQQLRGAADAG